MYNPFNKDKKHFLLLSMIKFSISISQLVIVIIYFDKQQAQHGNLCFFLISIYCKVMFLIRFYFITGFVPRSILLPI